MCLFWNPGLYSNCLCLQPPHLGLSWDPDALWRVVSWHAGNDGDQNRSQNISIFARGLSPAGFLKLTDFSLLQNDIFYRPALAPGSCTFSSNDRCACFGWTGSAPPFLPSNCMLGFGYRRLVSIGASQQRSLDSRAGTVNTFCHKHDCHLRILQACILCSKCLNFNPFHPPSNHGC